MFHNHFFTEIARSVNPPAKPGWELDARGDGVELARELTWGSTTITLACHCGQTKQVTHIGQAP